MVRTGQDCGLRVQRSTSCALLHQRAASSGLLLDLCGGSSDFVNLTKMLIYTPHNTQHIPNLRSEVVWHRVAAARGSAGPTL